MISKTKKIAFTAIWFAFPIALLILIECTLQIFRTPEDVPIVNQVHYDNIEWYEINRTYLQKFFPYNIVYVPEFKPAHFKKEKPKNLFRIICLGGSSMFGTPYLITANISGMIRRQLRHMYPDKKIEVINFAATAINSNVVRRFISDLEQFEPNLILIYMGHNEFYGPDGVGASAVEKALPFVISLKYFFRELRIGSWLRTTLRSFSSDPESAKEINLMREVSAENHVQINSDDAQRVFRLFADNLSFIIDFFSERHIPVIVSDVTSNLDFMPFAYDWDIDDKNINRLRDSVSESDLQELKALLLRDSTNAMIHYLTGKIYLRTGRPKAALWHLQQARDLDLLKFRAPQKINSLIQTICSEKNIPFISADAYISQHSPNGIPDKELFWEHLHLNYLGYYYISELFLRKIRELNLVTVANDHDIVTILPLQPDSLNVCWLDLAYADLGMRNLTAAWPFSNYAVTPVVLGSAPPALHNIAEEVFMKKIAWIDGCYSSAGYFEKQGQYEQARTTYRAVIEEYPYNYYAHYLLARLYKDTGDLPRAYRHYTISLESNADFLQSNLELGLIENNMAMFDEAIKHFTNALQLVPVNGYASIKANIYYGLSAAHANRGDTDTGLEYVKKALEQLPDYRPAQLLQQQIKQHKADEIN